MESGGDRRGEPVAPVDYQVDQESHRARGNDETLVRRRTGARGGGGGLDATRAAGVSVIYCMGVHANGCYSTFILPHGTNTLFDSSVLPCNGFGPFGPDEPKNSGQRYCLRREILRREIDGELQL